MRRSIVCRAALLVVLLATFGVKAQISRRSGVPFVGLRTATVTRDGKVTTDVGTVARRSDGSTYVQMHGLVLIFDVAGKRSITLNAKAMTYSVSPDPNLKVDPWPADYAQQYMAKLGAEGSTREIDGGWVIKTVGQRNIDGVDAALLALTNSDGRAGAVVFAGVGR